MKITCGAVEELKDQSALKTEGKRMNIQFLAVLGFLVQESK